MIRETRSSRSSPVWTAASTSGTAPRVDHQADAAAAVRRNPARVIAGEYQRIGQDRTRMSGTVGNPEDNNDDD